LASGRTGVERERPAIRSLPQGAGAVVGIFQFWPKVAETVAPVPRRFLRGALFGRIVWGGARRLEFPSRIAVLSEVKSAFVPSLKNLLIMKTTHSKSKRAASSSPRRWSAKVTRTSDAMDLKKDVFKQDDPTKIARSVKRSAERSSRRKTGAYRSAVSMVSFYENRAGQNLSPSKRKVLQRTKTKLKEEFGKTDA